MRLNASTKRMLELVTPYVTYGVPSIATIRNLLYKRGYARVGKQRVPLSSNAIIEENLRKYNIICMEDLVHEIVTLGKHFKEANNFLWPFKLNAPTGGFSNVKTHFNEGGDVGDRENYINTLVTRML